MELPHSRWFRSVVWNTKTNRPVSIAPPKATSQPFSFNTFKELENDGIICQELLDGFMINCFRVAGDEILHITSRSKLDAAGKFYSDKSFRELFTEAYMNTLESPHYNENAIQGNSNDLRSPDDTKGEVATFFSFLVQHKEHRIVKKITENRVYLIQSGVVYSDGRIHFEDSPTTFLNNENVTNIKYKTDKPKGTYLDIVQRNPDGLSEVNNWIKKTLLDKSWDFQGLVFKDKFGNRWRFRSEKYSAVKSLRGNSPTFRDRFAQLYTQNLLPKYLEYYEDELMYMTVHMLFMNSLIKLIYDYYVDVHILKTTRLSEIDKMFHPHLYSLHGIYLTQLRPVGSSITLGDIQAYLHKLPWQRVSFLIKKIVNQETQQNAVSNPESAVTEVATVTTVTTEASNSS
jgi:hypothetical protein